MYVIFVNDVFNRNTAFYLRVCIQSALDIFTSSNLRSLIVTAKQSITFVNKGVMCLLDVDIESDVTTGINTFFSLQNLINQKSFVDTLQSNGYIDVDWYTDCHVNRSELFSNMLDNVELYQRYHRILCDRVQTAMNTIQKHPIALIIFGDVVANRGENVELSVESVFYLYHDIIINDSFDFNRYYFNDLTRDIPRTTRACNDLIWVSGNLRTVMARMHSFHDKLRTDGQIVSTTTRTMPDGSTQSYNHFDTSDHQLNQLCRLKRIPYIPLKINAKFPSYSEDIVRRAFRLQTVAPRGRKQPPIISKKKKLRSRSVLSDGTDHSIEDIQVSMQQLSDGTQDLMDDGLASMPALSDDMDELIDDTLSIGTAPQMFDTSIANVNTSVDDTNLYADESATCDKLSETISNSAIIAAGEHFSLMFMKALKSEERGNNNSNSSHTHSIDRALNSMAQSSNQIFEKLKSNLKSNKYKSPKMIKCDCCNLTFESNKLLNRHKRQMNSSDKAFICQICKHRVRSTTELIKHLKTHFM